MTFRGLALTSIRLFSITSAQPYLPLMMRITETGFFVYQPLPAASLQARLASWQEQRVIINLAAQIFDMQGVCCAGTDSYTR